MLYTGIVALKDIAPILVYKNFLLLHVSIFILCDPHLFPIYKNQARYFLHVFLKTCKSVYGHQMLVYNVHALLHLVDDCENFGVLDNFSAFKFENQLGIIKRSLRGSKFALQQAINRISEKNVGLQFKTIDNSFIFKHVHSTGVTLTRNICEQYKLVIYRDVKFSVSDRDRYVMHKDFSYLKIFNIISCNSKTYFICQKFQTVSAVYTYPMDSLKLKIASVSNLSDYISVPFTDVYRKCCCLKSDDSVVLLPLFINLD